MVSRKLSPLERASMAGLTCRVVEICVFRFVRDDPHYLLLRRSKKEPVYPGIWQLVSGMIEGEEKAYEAALRELREETSLQPLRFWVAPFVNAFYNPVEDQVNVTTMFAAEVDPAVEVAISPEHEEFQWLSSDDAMVRLVWPGQRQGLRVVHQEITLGEQAGRLLQIDVPKGRRG